VHLVQAYPWTLFFVGYAILVVAMVVFRHTARLLPIVLCLHPLGYLLADKQGNTPQWGGAAFAFLALAWLLSGRWLAWAPPSDRLLRWVGLFVAWSAVSLLVNRNWETGLPALAKLVVTMSAFVICQAEGFRLRRLLLPLSVTGAIIGVDLVASDLLGGRVGAPFGFSGHLRASVNMLAIVEVVVVAAWLPFLRTQTGARRVAVQALILLAILGIIAGASRQAAFSLCVVLLLWAVRRPDLHRRIALSLGAAALLLAFGVSTFALAERFHSLFDQAGSSAVVDISAYNRPAVMGMGVELFLDHPLTGVGPGACSSHLHGYAAPEMFEWRRLTAAPDLRFISPHCLYLRVADEAGLPGLALILGIFGTIAWRAARGFRRASPTGEDMGILLVLVPLFVSALVGDWQFHSPVLWGFLGMASAAFRAEGRRAPAGMAGPTGDEGLPAVSAPDPVEVS